MKKKNLSNLDLKKGTISKLSSKTIVGGNELDGSYVVCPVMISINVDCNWSQLNTGDEPPKLIG